VSLTISMVHVNGAISQYTFAYVARLPLEVEVVRLA